MGGYLRINCDIAIWFLIISHAEKQISEVWWYPAQQAICQMVLIEVVSLVVVFLTFLLHYRSLSWLPEMKKPRMDGSYMLLMSVKWLNEHLHQKIPVCSSLLNTVSLLELWVRFRRDDNTVDFIFSESWVSQWGTLHILYENTRLYHN